jgi:hypothetical protein
MSPADFYALLFELTLPKYGYSITEIHDLYPFERDFLIEMHIERAKKEATK